MTSARKFQRQQRRMFKRMAPRIAGHPVMVTINSVFAMLGDSRFAEATAQFLKVIYAAAMGRADRQECFCCLEPWAPARAAVLIGCAEVLGPPGPPLGHVMMFAICDQCTGDQAALAAALERDFGKYKLISSETGTA